MKKAKEGAKDSSGGKDRRQRSKERKGEKSRHKRKGQNSAETELENVNISDIDFDDETLEALPKHCKPIWVFMHDRKEMIEQIFATIQDSALQKLLPGELKNYNAEQVKNMCSEQLMTMSEDHILYILTGGDPDTFIEKPAEGAATSTEDTATGSVKRKYDEETDSKENPEKRSSAADNASDERSSETLELYANPTEIRSLDEEDSILTLLGEDDTDLELLELEMRAKAIRALLRTKGMQSSDDESKT